MEMYNKMVREQKAVQKRLEEEHKRYKEQVETRLQERKSRREGEVAALLGLGEKQKTMLAKSRQV